jgi:hypothetical protein
VEVPVVQASVEAAAKVNTVEVSAVEGPAVQTSVEAAVEAPVVVKAVAV